eukprot:TRINITY_DN76293_c0_g1_i1.p1 TRINITY_DN76293_c0_g1~~TRINITY_DN76293_c0_g1_i1.p1  ORF type:complete len:1392 (+),score=217.39 TRINITY_DN76293_c0_g1_i1:56-4177(+)
MAVSSVPALPEKTPEKTEKQPDAVSNPSGGEPKPPPRLSCLAHLFLTDISGIVSHAARTKRLELSDLWGTPQSCEELYEDFKLRWAKEQEKPKSKVRVTRVFMAMNGGMMCGAVFLQLVAAIGQFSGPLLLNRILKVIEVNQGSDCTDPALLGQDQEMCKPWMGYLLCGALFASLFLSMMFQNLGSYIMKLVAIRIRGVLISAVYIKAMKLSSIGMNDVGSGKINNLTANDAEQLLMSIFVVGNVIIAPVQLVVSFVLLGMSIGATFLAGLATVIIILIVAVLMMRVSFKYKVIQSKLADSRIKLTNELLSGVRVVKSYGWELPFGKEVARARNAETAALRTQMYYRCFIVVVIISSPVLLAATTFSTFAATGGLLTPATVFTCFAVMNLMRFPMAFLPFAMIEAVKLVVAFGRLQSMLMAEEQKPSDDASASSGCEALQILNSEFGYVYSEESQGGKGKGRKGSCFGRLCGKGKGKGKGDESRASDGGDAEKTEKVDESTLVEVTRESGRVLKMARVLSVEKFTATPGGLTLVVGPVGSGKSTLLAALLGEVEVIKGPGAVLPKGVGFAAQVPWIVNATVEQNIKLGVSDRGEEVYRTVLDKCCLNDDLDNLPAGDQTEIGERGVNLSGGQKARVAVARAVYRDCGLYLFDDPLAAVDAHVGQRMFTEVFGPKGLLAGKTRILVTHQVQYMPLADHVVVVEDGCITDAGSYADLIGKGLKFDGLGSQPVEESKAEQKEKEISKVTPQEKQANRTSVLVQAEGSSEGAVGLKTYIQFIKKGMGTGSFLVMLTALTSGVALRLASDFWLAWWSEDSEMFGLSLGSIILIYFAIVVGQGFSTYMRSVTIMALGMIKASRNLYFLLYHSVFRAPAMFFDVTPTGRLLNRFTADMDILDNSLPGVLGQTTGTLELIFASLIANLVAGPMVIVIIIPCTVVYVWIVAKYRHFARDIQRLESVSKSPIFNRISETLNGLSTVRAAGYQGMLQAQTFTDIDRNQACTHLRERAQVWLTMRLEMLSVFISTGSAVAPLLPFALDNANSALVGVALIHSLELSKFVQSITQMLAQVEQKFTSVERIFEYCSLPSEAALVTPADASLAPGWPLKGAIEFRDVTMRYRPELEPALKGLSFVVGAGEKIGVVGRTGSGKSSVIVALLRLTEIECGKIFLDGHDLSQVGLQVLRQSLSMIPQEPVLFGNSSLRLNLDPFSQHSDAVLLDALSKVQMKPEATRSSRGSVVLPDGLDTNVTEGGGGFSVGQRQLLCLARAVLRHSRVILLDEATASVDGETDALIQQTIQDAFAESTVLCIAHRIRTILDSDKVLVINQGVCQELGTPDELLRSPASHLRALAVESGIDVPGEKDAPTSQAEDRIMGL